MTLVAILILTTTLCIASTIFSEANAKYLAGDFKAAAAMYEKALDSGQNTAAVYYNLGNTSLRLGRKGEAMLYYQRALKAAPRDRDLRWNIRVLGDALVDRIEERSGNPLYTPLAKSSGWFTPDEAAMALSFSLAALALILASGAVVPKTKPALALPRTLLMLSVFFSAALMALEWHENKEPTAVVLEREVTAHYGPSDREPKAFTLHEGALGRVIDESGDWVYLSLKNGAMGWLRKNACELV